MENVKPNSETNESNQQSSILPNATANQSIPSQPTLSKPISLIAPTNTLARNSSEPQMYENLHSQVEFFFLIL